MNKHNAKDYLPLVQALAEGKVIQYSPVIPVGGEEWFDLADPEFKLRPERYRIKPEPRKAWVWWPPVGRDDHPVVMPYKHAREWAEIRGGHITEVTE